MYSSLDLDHPLKEHIDDMLEIIESDDLPNLD
jgi:hypothetical protein